MTVETTLAALQAKMPNARWHLGEYTRTGCEFLAQLDPAAPPSEPSSRVSLEYHSKGWTEGAAFLHTKQHGCERLDARKPDILADVVFDRLKRIAEDHTRRGEAARRALAFVIVTVKVPPLEPTTEDK